jgi:hypothetical protein
VSREFRGGSFDVGQRSAPVPQRQQNEPTPAEKAEWAKNASGNLIAAYEHVIAAIGEMTAAQATRDVEAWKRNRRSAESAMTSLVDHAARAGSHASNATDSEVRKKLEESQKLVDAAQAALAQAPAAPVPAAPALSCESALLAALPPNDHTGSTKQVFDTARASVERVIRSEMVFSDFAAFKKVLGDFGDHEITARFRRFNPLTQTQLLAIFEDGKVRARARAREAAMQQAAAAPPSASKVAPTLAKESGSSSSSTAEKRTDGTHDAADSAPLLRDGAHAEAPLQWEPEIVVLLKPAAGGATPKVGAVDAHTDAPQVADKVRDPALAANGPLAWNPAAQSVVATEPPRAAQSDPATESPSESSDEALELPPGRRYQRIAGNYAVVIDVPWFLDGATAKGGRLVSPAKMMEVLRHLREQGVFAGAPDESLQRASEDLGIRPTHQQQQVLRLGADVFGTIGLPATSSAMVSSHGDGLKVAVRHEAKLAPGAKIAVSGETAESVYRALESYTGLTIDSAYKVPSFAMSAGEGTAYRDVGRDQLENLFGPEQWQSWSAAHGEQLAGLDGAALSVASDLSSTEQARVRAWLDGFGLGSATRRLTRQMFALMEEVEASEHRDLIRGALARDAALAVGIAGNRDGIDENTLRIYVHAAKYEAERGKHVPHDRLGSMVIGAEAAASLIDEELPAQLHAGGGLIVDGDNVSFDVKIDWNRIPMGQAGRDAFAQRPWKIDVDWTFERPGEVVHKHTASADCAHKLKLRPGETSGIWTVHAFVRTSHFLPTHIGPIQIEAKTEEARMADLRGDAIGERAAGAMVSVEKDFNIGVIDDVISKRSDDHGRFWIGPQGFKPRTAEERGKEREAEIQQLEQMAAYFKARPGKYNDALAAVERTIARRKDEDETLRTMEASGATTFDVRATFLSRDNAVPSGPLDVVGTIRPLDPAVARVAGIDASTKVVTLRDSTRRFDSDTMTFTGVGATFEQALESAFVELCKAYPDGRISLFAEERDASGKTTTSRTIGFELPTTSQLKSIKRKVFAPAVQIGLAFAAAMSAMFPPAIAVMPLMIGVAHGTAATLDEIIDRSRNGTLDRHQFLFGQLALSMLPALRLARAVQSRGGLVYALDMSDTIGNVVMLAPQIKQALELMQNRDVAGLAQLYSEMTQMEQSSHASDPALAKRRAEFEQRAQAFRDHLYRAFNEAAGQQVLFMAPGHIFKGVHGHAGSGDALGRHIDDGYDAKHRRVVDVEETTTTTEKTPRHERAGSHDTTHSESGQSRDHIEPSTKPTNRVLLAGADEDLVRAAPYVQPAPGYLDVILHGTVDDFIVKTDSGTVSIDHRALAAYIKKSGAKYRRIRLLSCKTGAHNKGAAQHLANKTGVPVVAPSDKLWIHAPEGDGQWARLTIGPREDRDTGHWVEFEPTKSSSRYEKAAEPKPTTARERFEAKRSKAQKEEEDGTPSHDKAETNESRAHAAKELGVGGHDDAPHGRRELSKAEQKVDRTLANKLALILPPGARQADPQGNPFAIELAHGKKKISVQIRVDDALSDPQVVQTSGHIEVAISSTVDDVGLQLASAMSRAQALATGQHSINGADANVHAARARYVLAELDEVGALPGREPKALPGIRARVDAVLHEVGIRARDDVKHVFPDHPEIARRVELYLDGLVSRPSASKGTDLVQYSSDANTHLDSLRGHVSGEGKDQLVATERKALDGQLRLESSRRVFDPLNAESIQQELSGESLVELARVRNSMLDAINDPNLAGPERTARLNAELARARDLGVPDSAIDAMRQGVASISHADQVSPGLVLDVATGTFHGSTSEGQAAAPRSIRQLMSEVDAANQKAREQGLGIQYVIVIHDPRTDAAGGAKAMVEVLSRPLPRYRMPGTGDSTAPVAGNNPGELTLDVGVGRGAFAAEKVPESDRQGMIVQTDIIANAEAAQERRYYAGTSDAGPSHTAGAVVVFADVLKHPELMNAGPGDPATAGTRRMFVNNLSAHYDEHLPPELRWTGPQYTTLAKGLAESMAEGGVVDIVWDMSPETKGGEQGSRGHITGPELLKALEATGREVHLEQASAATAANPHDKQPVPRDKTPIAPETNDYTVDAGRSAAPDPQKLRKYVPPTPSNRWIIKFGRPLSTEGASKQK